MRQIEDRWRINPRDPPIVAETYLNIIKSYKLTDNNHKDINRYAQRQFSQFINQKCTKICFGIKNANFNNCLDNCSSKLLAASKEYESVQEDFNKVYETYEKSGSNYFQS